jgi:N-succinyldiaminopimelate aminotransferase
LNAAPKVAARVAGMPETVFARYARLAAASGAVNLGQGFPDDPPPACVRAALAAAIDGGHQYAPSLGLPALRRAVAALSATADRPLDPDRDVTITVGATEALYATIMATLDPGDEMLLIEPMYDAYPAAVRLAGGIPVAVPLSPSPQGFTLSPERLAAAVTPRTRAILVNDPHNPTGAVLPAETAAAIADLAREHDLTLIVDAVYEHVAFGATTSLARYAPERTLTIGSAGKTFGVTGWKVGWVTGPAPLIEGIARLRQWTSFAVATPLQGAVAALLAAVGAGGEVDAALSAQREGLAARHDLLLQGLRDAGATAIPAHGGYFIHAEVSAWGWDDDAALCDALPDHAGVVAIPGSAFTLTRAPGVWVRFAFCRGEATVREGVRRLRALRPR